MNLENYNIINTKSIDQRIEPIEPTEPSRISMSKAILKNLLSFVAMNIFYTNLVTSFVLSYDYKSPEKAESVIEQGCKDNFILENLIIKPGKPVREITYWIYNQIDRK